jgi:hypothetical protein
MSQMPKIQRARFIPPGVLLVITNEEASLVEVRSSLADLEELRQKVDQVELTESKAEEKAYRDMLSVACEFPNSPPARFIQYLRDKVARARAAQDLLEK